MKTKKKLAGVATVYPMHIQRDGSFDEDGHLDSLFHGDLLKLLIPRGTHVEITVKIKVSDTPILAGPINIHS
jgi:hypothetical protein